MIRYLPILLLAACSTTPRLVEKPVLVDAPRRVYVPIDPALTQPIRHDPRWLTCGEAIAAAEAGVRVAEQYADRLKSISEIQGAPTIK